MEFDGVSERRKEKLMQVFSHAALRSIIQLMYLKNGTKQK